MKNLILLFGLLATTLIGMELTKTDEDIFDDGPDILEGIILKPNEVVYGGTGCPQGTADYRFEDNGSLVFLPQTYSASSNGSSLVRKTCNIAWQPAGLSGDVLMEGDEIDGTNQLSDIASAYIAAENFYNGARNNPIKQSLNGNGHFSIFVPPPAHAVEGENLIVRLNTSIIIKAPSSSSTSWWNPFTWKIPTSLWGAKTSDSTLDDNVSVTQITIPLPQGKKIK